MAFARSIASSAPMRLRAFDDAVTFALAKARQMVDLQGDRMFGA